MIIKNRKNYIIKNALQILQGVFFYELTNKLKL